MPCYNVSSSCVRCLRCGLHVFSVKNFPHFTWWIHELPPCKRDRFWNLVGCFDSRSSCLRAGFPRHLFAWHSCVRMPFQLSPRILNNVFVLVGLPDKRNRCLSIAEHCQVLAFRVPILAFLVSEQLSQLGSMLLATHDLVWKSFKLLSISPRTTYIISEGVSFNKVNFVILSKNLTHFCFHRHANSHQCVSLASRPDQCEWTS